MLFCDNVWKFIVIEIIFFEEYWDFQQYVECMLWIRVGVVGFLCIDVLEKYGGVGGSFVYEVVIFQEQVCVGNISWVKGVYEIVSYYIVSCGMLEQKYCWFFKFVFGEWVGVIVMIELGIGLDLQVVCMWVEC